MKTIPCATCSEQFTTKTSHAKYCSPQCKDKARRTTSGLSCYICGKAMVKGSTSKPQGEAAHNKCRVDANTIYTHGTTGYPTWLPMRDMQSRAGRIPYGVRRDGQG